jgi:hypothetical protein
MSDPTDLTSSIVDNATSPNSVTLDGQTSTSNKLTDQIAAQKFLQANNNVAALSNGTAMFGGFSVNAPGPRGRRGH